ncbi:hypothetical protein ABZ942_03345 [Nocardia sp. NPDC046473]|uniref:hypothetical protein n=1 Tax=Nocardia sp. NPDC046473 TaxID=3155733 RepID=UPI0033E1C25F
MRFTNRPSATCSNFGTRSKLSARWVSIPVAIAATLLVGSLAGIASANAQDTGVNMQEQCEKQFPPIPPLAGAYAYIADQHSAHSWKCGYYVVVVGEPVPEVVDDLSIDVQAFCNRHHAGRAIVLDEGNPYSWRCRP